MTLASEDVPLLRWAVTQLADALHECPVDATVRIERDPDADANGDLTDP